MPRISFVIFLLALAVRWIYCLAVFLGMGKPGLLGVDSHLYLEVGRIFSGHFSALHGLGFLGHNTTVMPVATWLLAFAHFIGGEQAALTFVLMQSVLDAGTCLLVYKIADTIDPRFSLLAGIASVINPTQIVLSGLVYVDTAFTFFVALFLYGAIRWWRMPGWSSIALIAVAIGLATLTRALAAPFAFVLPAALLFVIWLESRLTRKLALQLCILPLAFLIAVGPLIYRNGTKYGAWSLTAQSGLHLALWVVPLIGEARDGTPWATGFAVMQKRATENEAYAAANPFEKSRIYLDIAEQELAKVGVLPVIKAWTNGAAINVAAPAAILSPPVSQLPRTGFYDTPGASPTEKIFNFLFRSDNNTYTWILLIGLLGVAIMRVIQLVGAIRMLKEPHCRGALLIFVIWIAYILAVNGPIASPKYRLPMEVPLCILTGAGLSVLVRPRNA